MSQTVHLLIASSREGRLGEPIAKWAREQIEVSFNAAIEVIDLYEENLPFFNASIAPSRQPDRSVHGRAWAEKMQQVERLVIVTPEYNRGVPAALKNALDYLWEEWHDLPIAVMSYGYIDGGASASAHLKDTLGWLKANQVGSVQLQLAVDMLDETGGFKDVNGALAGNTPKLKVLVGSLLEA